MVLEASEDALTGRAIYPFELGYLPDQFKKKAEDELGDSSENRERCMKEIKDMMQDDENFHGRKFEDDFILQYLMCRKFNVPRAFKQLQSMVELTRKHPQVFSGFKFENLVVNTRKNILRFLPWRCPDGCAIMLIKLDNWDPDEFAVEDLKRMVLIYLLQALRDPMTQVNGFKLIFDVKSNPAKHIRHATPNNMHLMYHGPMECSPGRFKAIHILNKSLTFKVAFFLIKPFLTSKIKQRVVLHSEPAELLHHFPASTIPEEYGGTLKEQDSTEWLKNALQPESLVSLVGWSQQN